jgi:hypothetical protein
MLRPLLHTTTNVQSGLRILGILLAFPMILNSEMIRSRWGVGEPPSVHTAIAGVILIATLATHAWLGLRDDREGGHGVPSKDAEASV